MCYCYTKPAVRGNGRPAVRYTKKVEDGKSRLSTLILSQEADCSVKARRMAWVVMTLEGKLSNVVAVEFQRV
ncbi:hypothetical protein C3L33_03102, partial [Rhododendron williamsianum]